MVKRLNSLANRSGNNSQQSSVSPALSFQPSQLIETEAPLPSNSNSPELA